METAKSGDGRTYEIIGAAMDVHKELDLAFWRRSEFMPEAPYGRSNCWLTVILINPEEFGVDREEVRLALEKENIESRPIWKPMHLQPIFKGCRVRGGKVREDLFQRGLYLPSGTQMTEEDFMRVLNVLKNSHRRNKS